MNTDITLKKLNYNEQYMILDIINNDADLKRTFAGENNTRTRIINSSYVATINKNNTIVGFIMLVYDQKNDIHELDIGLLQGYQNHGYGTIALGKLKEIIQKENVNVSIQTRKENIPAIRIITKNNFQLISEDSEYNYYGIKVLRR